MLMGATLPAIARWLESTPRGISWLGFFYGGNIAGAVLGCLLAGFYLLRVYDMATGIYFAAALNAVVALIALGLASLTPYSAEERAKENRGSRIEDRGLKTEVSGVSYDPGTAALTRPARLDPRSASNPQSSILDPPCSIFARPWSVYTAIALSGASALAAEVIWTRLLSLLLGGTVYTFSIILAVFLTGLGLGSGLGSVLARGSLRPRILLGWCQWLLGAAIAWTGYMLAHSLPYWPINPSLSSSPWLNFQLDVVRCLWALLPATCLWGASFPLALAAVAVPGRDPGRLVGAVYAANTLGAIVGALAASL